ncbi:MAG TPA: CoA-binding protein [Ignisphaera sp.]|nr:CoA-binding protein [Ignisphaera sp.]
MSKEIIELFFNPRSIAVIGASRDPTKVGYQIVYNLKMKYRGKIYPINPKADEILGLKAYPSVLKVEDDIDLCVVSVPAPIVPQVIDECGKKGVKAAIVISAGFKEVGGEGIEREKKLIETAKKYGMRILGPNCVGVYVPKTGVNTTFLNPNRMGFPPHGYIAFISQSGAFGIAVLDWAAMRGIGISKFISVGNKADIDESDLLEYLVEDTDTRVITMYIEGIERGTQFMNIVKKTTTRKPVIALKSGRSEAGARAIASHTGSLAGADAVYDAAFKQTGIIRAYGMEDLFDMAIALSLQPPAKGRRVAILTVGGGSGVMATDAATDLGLEVPRLSDKTVEKLRKVLLPIASPYNPVDVTGSARDEHLIESIEILLKSGEIDAVIWIPYFMVPGISEEIVEKFIERAKKVNQELDVPIPIVGAATGGDYTWKLAKKAEEMGIPMYLSVERAAKAVWALYRYGEWLRKNGVFHEYIENFRKHALR